VRREGDRHVQTIKADTDMNGAALDRDEWESEIEDGSPNFRAGNGRICPSAALPIRRFSII
jgi:inorganic triphosphatase YgiF